MDNADVLIIGAGPAGIISAITCAKMGLDVILVDSKSFDQIGNKVCGDGLFKSFTTFLEKELGIKQPHGSEVSDTFDSMVLRVAGIDLPIEGHGFMVDRFLYGQRLLKEAIDLGIDVRADTRGVKAQIDGNSVIGVIVEEKNGSQYFIKAKITIDSSGRNYQIRKTLPQNLFPNIETRMNKSDIAGSYREIIRVNEDHLFQNKIFFEFRLDIPSGGYFWIFTKGKRMLNVGIGWPMNVKSQKGMKSHLWDILKEYYSDYEVLAKGGYTIPMRYPLMNAVASGFIVAGDAAFHANPFSAEGHGSALVAGYYAGKTAADAIKRAKFTEKELWNYNHSILKNFGGIHIKYQLILEMLRKIQITGLEFLLKRSILTEEVMKQIVDGESINTSSKLRIIWRSFPYYGIVIKLRRLQQQISFFDELLHSYPKDPTGFPHWFDQFNKSMNLIHDSSP
ncbi:MAG: NAD(P)/FAD-dependent oxidoreductase [Candidatus Hodarchaeales archaeon]|jgi:electron-transferring-flavoprotein dehydrogenase